MDRVTRPIKVRNLKKTPALMKLLLTAALALGAVLAVASFMPQLGYQAADLPLQGNTFANLENRGLAASEDNVMYFTNVSEDAQVIKLTIDSGDQQTLDGVHGTHLNAIGDDLYYISWKDGSVLRYNGSTKLNEQLLAGPVGQLCLYGDALYYIDIADGESLYAMALDGTDVRKLNAARTESFTIADQKIYYSDLNQSGKSYRMNLDGTNPTETHVPLGSRLFACGDAMYYTQSGDARLYCMDMATSTSVKIDTVTSLSVNADGQYLFFADAAEGNRLCRALVSGGKKEYLTHGPVYGVQVIGDYVGYVNADSSLMVLTSRDQEPVADVPEQDAAKEAL